MRPTDPTDLAARLLHAAGYHGRDEDVLTCLGEGKGHLAWAAFCGRVETARVLLQFGATPDETNELGAPVVHLACRQGRSSELVRVLVEAGGDPDTVEHGSSLVEVACTLGERELVGWLLARGADATRPGPLHAAARRGDVDLLDLLFEHAAALEDLCRMGQTPLGAAAGGGADAAVAVLLARGADPARADASGDTALHRAARFGGSVEVIQRLLAAGCPLDQANRRGRTPLMEACAGRRNRAVIEALLDRGARLDGRDQASGATALLLAAAAGDEALVNLLAARGADPQATDDRDRTAADLLKAHAKAEREHWMGRYG